MARRSRSISAEEFVLTDHLGEPRAVLRVREDDSVCLDLADENGRTRAMFGVLLDGTPGLYLYDDQGKTRSELSLGAGGLPNQVLRDDHGQVRVKLTVLPDGAPALAMLDGGGQPRAVLCLEDDGSPRLDLIDSLGNLRVTLTMLEDGISALSLLDSEGNSRAGLTVTHEGLPRLNLRDKDAKVRATLRVQEDGSPQLELYDSSGNSILDSLVSAQRAEPVPPSPQRTVSKITEVTEFHMRKLPLRASVALAVRSARRVVPLFRPVHDDPGKELRKDVLYAAISTAERIAMGWEVTVDEASHYGRLALREVDAPALGSSAAGVVARTVLAGASCLDDQGDEVIHQALGALNTAAECVAVSGSEVSQYEQARRSMTLAVVVDYQKLASLCLGEFPKPGEPVDLAEGGPLGPLWPDGEPEWYVRLTKEVSS